MPDVQESMDAPKLVHGPGSGNGQTEKDRPTTPSRDDDLSTLITNISEVPFCITGGYGDIFKGIHKMVGKVAMKRIRIGDTIDEKWALRFLGTSKRGGHLYLVSPFIENGNLLNYLERFPDANRVRLLCETSEAIAYLHQENMVHGDIKARNILVGADDHILLSEFGLAQFESAETFLSFKGGGTTRWQSPELMDAGYRTFTSDVYAFSMTIVEALTGRPPFSHVLGDVAVMQAVLFQNERPERTPMGSNVVSYEIAWQVAEACWPTEPGDRITMPEAFRRLKDDLLSQHRQRDQLYLSENICTYFLRMLR
ncbi:hypothetical protein FS837_008758, partial [Tulasnella sp. UAMH 9824]